MGQLNIRLDDDLKGKWKKYVEESDNHSSVSSLIRSGVAREMADEGTESTAENVESRLATIEEDISYLKHSTDAIDGKVGRLANALHQDQALADLAPEVFSALPEYGSREDAMEAFVSPPTDPDTGEAVEGYGSLEWVADAVSVDVERASDAIDKLKRDTARVREIRLNEETYYWKEV